MSVQMRLLTILLLCIMCVTVVGCGNGHDHIQIFNKSELIFDDINIPVKDGYFYDRHEKFIVDENTVGVTVYFSKKETWEMIEIEEVEIKSMEEHSSV